MTNRQKLALYGNAVIFQLLWFAAVLGAKAGMIWPAPTVLLILIVWGFVLAQQVRTDLRLALTGVLIAFTVEPIWIGQDLVLYPLQPASYFPPLWIVALWAGFAVCFNHSLKWLRNRYFLGALLGCAGSICSITAALRLNAIEMPQGWLAFVIQYGAIWALIVPLLSWYSTRIVVDKDPKKMIEDQPTSNRATHP